MHIDTRMTSKRAEGEKIVSPEMEWGSGCAYSDQHSVVDWEGIGVCWPGLEDTPARMSWRSIPTGE